MNDAEKKQSFSLPVQEAPPAEDSGRVDHRFQPGQSGNPSGRPKRTQEEKDALAAIKALAPDAVAKLQSLLESKKVSPAVKVRIAELILDRTYGKAETAVKVTSVAETVESSKTYILSLVDQIRAQGGEEPLALPSGDAD